MVAIRLKGHIDENGHLQAELPPGLLSGDVEITVEAAPQAIPESERWTQEELDNLIQPQARTGGEIIASGVVGAWANRDDITDGDEFIQEMRRKRRDRLNWSQAS